MAGCTAKHHAHKVGLGEAGTLLQQEGADPKVSASLYRAVVQAILLYGSTAWVVSTSIAKRIEGTYTEFMRLITGKRAMLWETPAAKGIREAAGNPVGKATVAQ